MKAELIHWNPGATMPLRVRMDVVCNTPDERVISNIRINSARQKGWQKLCPAHSRVAILCGSGPSLKDDLDELKWMEGDLFALNGAAKFLNESGLEPDYQVILDARKETADLIGPAKQHLFASQVDPSCFDRMPEATLWQATHGDLAMDFPDYHEDYCMVGGSVTVGNSAMILAYVMGYREIHCFGYDSSHREGKGHAFHQTINEGDPTTIVEFGGKEYVTSFTMRLQAQYFLGRMKALQDVGCSIKVHGSGLLPDMVNKPWTEKDKYRAIWNFSEYREVSPGEKVADTFVQISDIDAGDTVIDFGCGTGRGGMKIRDLIGASVMLTDFAENCLDENIDLPFKLHDLTKPLELRAKYGFCTDVMEHVPAEQVDAVLDTIFGSVDKAFFQISLVNDSLGALINEPLHLSVHPYSWWLGKLKAYGTMIWSENRGMNGLFYVKKTLTT